MRSSLFGFASLAVSVVAGCALPGSGDDSSTGAPPSQELASSPVNDPSNDAPLAPTTTSNLASPPDAGKTPTQPDPGPKPTANCSITKDSDGFFTRTSSESGYVAYVPKSYSPDKPMRLVVSLHGCGDTAANHARWSVNPYDSRDVQTHIGIAVDGASGGGSCWSVGADDDKVLAAVEDLAQCFWIDRSRVTIAGYSSGGQLAYRVGLKNASKFAGIIIEESGLYAAGDTPATLLANAARKIPITHRTHKDDPVFPLAQVQADWTLTLAAGFPLTTSITDGDHSGTSTDWATYLIPASKDWVAPQSGL